MINRVLAVVTLVLIAVSLLVPVHELANTAVHGKAYLWGESSNGARWFADHLEMAQHALVFLTALACIAVLHRPLVGISFVAFPLGALLVMALIRARDGHGVKLPMFDIVMLEFIAMGAVIGLERATRRPAP